VLCYSAIIILLLILRRTYRRMICTTRRWPLTKALLMHSVVYRLEFCLLPLFNTMLSAGTLEISELINRGLAKGRIAEHQLQPLQMLRTWCCCFRGSDWRRNSSFLNRTSIEAQFSIFCSIQFTLSSTAIAHGVLVKA
jgi:hypothetical protein